MVDEGGGWQMYSSLSNARVATDERLCRTKQQLVSDKGASWESGDMRVGGAVREVSLHRWLIGNEGRAHVGLSNTVAGGEMNDRFTEEEWHHSIRY